MIQSLTLLFLALAIETGVNCACDLPLSADPGKVDRAIADGVGWLKVNLREDGFFIYGWEPGFNRALAEDHLLRQIAAVGALAHASNYLGDEAGQLIARKQLELIVARYLEHDGESGRWRPTVSFRDANPVGFAGILLWSMRGLREQPKHFGAISQGLCRFLSSRQREDGSIAIGVSTEFPDPREGLDYYPGEALFGMIATCGEAGDDSTRAVLARALPFYRRRWQEEPSAAFIPWQTAAYSRAFRLADKVEYRDYVYEMNDWLIALQYRQASDGVPQDWLGGFAAHDDEAILETPPGITTASYAESLVEALWAARKAGDREREKNYLAALDSAAAFLLRLQYTEAKLLHVVPEHRRRLQGAFAGSLDDGRVRVDFCQHALMALVGFAQIIQHRGDRDATKSSSGGGPP